ncbi:MAG: methionine--tRNA ligase, partial [Candidatus Diapherotrites archaeon]|nr:methionine--tRNA ligase [Candidatus Diapherotrites archaeon]
MCCTKHFFISTAIDYPSGPPHAGHLYEKILADSLARGHRLMGFKVHFSTGLDCHGQKIAQKAAEAGKSPQEFVRQTGKLFESLCSLYRISFDDFIWTTEERHTVAVNAFLSAVEKKGDLFRGTYEGPYCVECETFYTEKDLVGGNCPVHGKKCVHFSEESFFFAMSRYQSRLVEHLRAHSEFLFPVSRRNELLARLQEPLKDLSISRTNFEWGIPLPADPRHRVYVWFDALINYLTTAGYPQKGFEEFWPADVHVIGRDIAWHHCVIWGSMLLSAGLPLPGTVLSHGFINDEFGEKMSKFKGNVVDPLELAGRFPSDSVRYFLLREIPLGEDGNFSEKVLSQRHNSELADELGNLVYRVAALIEKNAGGKVPSGTRDPCLFDSFSVRTYEQHLLS